MCVITVGVSGAVCDIALAVSGRHLTSEDWGKSHVSPCRVCDENGDRLLQVRAKPESRFV